MTRTTLHSAAKHAAAHGTTPAQSPGPTTTRRPKLSDLAGAARSDRNRAIDFYRVLAMAAVAIGHWLATVVGTDSDGEVIGGNLLEFAPEWSVMSWPLQVMPLFFVVGGFSSAMSLDSFTVKTGGGRPQDWTAARLRRMLAPTVTLATVWFVALAAAALFGQTALIGLGAMSAAIPLWFLANYTIDTAIAPYVLPAFRANPLPVAGGGVAVFCALEIARFAGVPFLPQLNWVLGWLLFQILGFAWRDGLLPSPRILAGFSAGLWALAIAAVTLGPWPVSMVNFPGLAHSPTNPPTLALLLFGTAFSTMAIAAAPTISAWLARTPKAWAAVVGANTVAMSVYLWHFTAIVVAAAIFSTVGWLPNAPVASTLWWAQKLPLMAAATVILAGIVALVSSVERKALMAPRTPWQPGTSAFRPLGGRLSILAVSGILSAALKLWAHSGNLLTVTAAIAALLAVWHLALRTTSDADQALSPANTVG